MFSIVTIQIIGKQQNPVFGRLLVRLLAHPPCRILTAESPVSTVRPTAIYLFSDSCREILQQQAFSRGAIAIVNAENTGILRLLQEHGIHTVPCGLSDHDTFTLASSTEESIVISLQRSLTALTGDIVDPMEFPVCPELAASLSRYRLMALCAIGCLTGNTQKLISFLRLPPV